MNKNLNFKYAYELIEALENKNVHQIVINQAGGKKLIYDRKKIQWIPVTKRLPDKDGLYLVTTSKGQVQIHVFNHSGNSEEYWMRCNKAWMLLPEPYTESER